MCWNRSVASRALSIASKWNLCFTICPEHSETNGRETNVSERMKPRGLVCSTICPGTLSSVTIGHSKPNYWIGSVFTTAC